MSDSLDVIGSHVRIGSSAGSQVHKTLGESRSCAALRYSFQKVELKFDANSRFVFQTQPAGMAAEQYRLLQRRLSSQFQGSATLLVTSPGSGDGKTLNAINLAWCLAQSYGPTLVVEADLRNPCMTRLFGCAIARGVESSFTGEIEPEAAVRSVGNSPLHVAMVAKRQLDFLHLGDLSGVRAFLKWARSAFRWVIVDAPPSFLSAEVEDLTSLVDGALLVVRTRSTRRELVQKSLELLGNRVVGVILNEASLCLDTHYRYVTSYYDAYGNKKR